MISAKFTAVLFTLSLSFLVQAATSGQDMISPIYPKAIYGEDDRIESYLHSNPGLVEISKSVAGQVHYRALTPDPTNPQMLDFDRYVFSEEFSLCPNQPLESQNMLMGCSGVLVGPDLLLTASHCVTEEADCQNLRWVFDFTNEREQIAAENVFSCKEVIASSYQNDLKKHLDYALIKLDRPAIGKRVVNYRKSGQILPNTEVAVIGHPSGLPLKIADNGKVALLTKTDIPLNAKELVKSIMHDRYVFKTNVDAFEGNSGSPVINMKTLELEGILIEGAEDFEMVDLYGDGSTFCRKVTRLKDSLWYAEEMVQRITAIKELQ